MSAQLLLYILKRLLVMIPTLFVIAVLCFLVLNLAPARPGQGMGGEGQEASDSKAAKQSQLVFREFFNYDKPIFLNYYFWTDTDEVRELLTTVIDGRAYNSCKSSLTQQNPDYDDATLRSECGERIDYSQQIEAQNDLDDYGEYIVPELIEILSGDDSLTMKNLVIEQLSLNGRKRSAFLGLEKDMPPELIKVQNEIKRHNQMISRWIIGSSPTDQERAQTEILEATATTARHAAHAVLTGPLGGPLSLAMASATPTGVQTLTSAPDYRFKIVRDLWLAWYDVNTDRFDYSTGESVQRFFLDTRFAKYMGNLLRGDFGFSNNFEPVLPELLRRIKYSFLLSSLAIILTYFLSIPLGIFSAVKQHTVTDQTITLILFILYSLPSFFVGIMLVRYVPSDSWLYTNGLFLDDPYMTTGEQLVDVIRHLILPVFCLTYGGLAALSRFARTGLLDVIRSDYIRTARAKGLAEPVVIVKHAMRNGMIPILTLLGTLLPALFGGSIVIESIFEIPGMGQYMLAAIFAKDYSIIMAVLMMSAVLTLIGLLISDISYALVDPRITFD